MLVKVSLLIGILVGLITLISVTISAYLKANERFRTHLESIIKQNDNKTREWIKLIFLEYYYPFDERVKDINLRLKKIEKNREKNND